MDAIDLPEGGRFGQRTQALHDGIDEAVAANEERREDHWQPASSAIPEEYRNEHNVGADQQRMVSPICEEFGSAQVDGVVERRERQGGAKRTTKRPVFPEDRLRITIKEQADEKNAREANAEQSTRFVDCRE